MTIPEVRYIDLPPPVGRAEKTRQEDIVDFWHDKRIVHTFQQDVGWNVTTYDMHARLHINMRQTKIHICI